MFLYQSPFKLIKNFIFPSVWLNERLTSTCQNLQKWKQQFEQIFRECLSPGYFELKGNLGSSVSHHAV